MNEQMTGDCLNQVGMSEDLDSDGKEVSNCEADHSTSFSPRNEFGTERTSSTDAQISGNARLFTLLEKYKEECTRLQDQVKLLMEEFRVARSEVMTLEEEKENLNRCLCRDAVDAGRLLEEKNDEMADLTERYNKETLLLSETQAQLSSAKAEMEFLVGEHRKKSLSVERELDLLRNDRDRSDASHQNLKEENIRLKAKVDALSERIGSMQNDVMYSSSQWEARNLEEENQSKIALALQTMEAEYKTTTEDLERRNGELEEALARTKDRLKVSELQGSILEEDIGRFQNLVSSLQEKVFVAEACHENAEQMVRDLVSSKSSLKHDLELVEETLEAEKEARREAKREADGKTTELLDQVKRTEEVLRKTEDQISRQSEEIEDLEEQKRKLEDVVKKLDAEKLRLEQCLLKKKNCVKTLEDELKRSNKEDEKLKCEMAEKVDEIERLKEELRELQEVRSKEDALKDLWQEEVVSRSMLGLRVAHIEREKQATANKLNGEMRKRKATQRLKEGVDRELRQERQRNTKLRRKLNRMKIRLAMVQKEKDQLDAMTPPIKVPLCRYGILLTDKSQKPKDVVGHLGDSEPGENPTETKGAWQDGEISNETVDLRDRTFDTLNEKLKEINVRLVEQAIAREVSEKLRNDNYAAVHAEFQRVKDNLKSELSRLHKKNLELELQRDSAVKEAEKFEKLYKNQRTQHLDTIAALEAAKRRLFKRQLQ